MPSIAGNLLARSNGGSSPQKRRLRSNSAAGDDMICTTPSKPCSPLTRKSPRRCLNDSPSSPAKEMVANCREKFTKLRKSPVKKLSDCFVEKPTWNPTDSEQLSAVKEVLHVSMAPSTVVCREDEQKRVLEFCKQCIEQEKAGSLYMCGCPGTGKSLSMGNVKEYLIDWAKETGLQSLDVLPINCTSLAKTSDIFIKILGNNQPQKKVKASTSPLQHLQNLYSQKQQSPSLKMQLIIADELDYLITRDRAVLHDLFMLTTLPFSRCILIGIANAIDLADRFLPKLQSLNCKPMVVTFRAYAVDQIIRILKQRLMVLPYTVFQPQALELCARKVAAASGDMRKALCICRSAIEVLEAEVRESTCNQNLTSIERGFSNQYLASATEILAKKEKYIILLCSAVKHLRKGKKDTTVGELNRSYTEICKTTSIPPVGIMELSSMCRVLGDQGILKVGQSREDKLRRITLKVDEADIIFALQGIRFFRNCLQ